WRRCARAPVSWKCTDRGSGGTTRAHTGIQYATIRPPAMASQAMALCHGTAEFQASPSGAVTNKCLRPARTMTYHLLGGQTVNSLRAAFSRSNCVTHPLDHARTACILAASLAIVLSGSEPSAGQERIMFRAGISDPVNTVLAWYVARDAGFYAAQGLEVEI